MARRVALALLALGLALSLAGTVRAYSGGPITDQIENLFWAITFFAVLVALVVFGILFWFLIRYRQSVSPNPATEIHGNRRLEFVWTVIPTIILIIISAISVPVLLYTDTPPKPDTTVTVIAQRFTWNFRYEDNTTSSDLWIQEKIVVALDVTSVDVAHSFAVADLGVKIDAIPGRMNHFWVRADAPGDYLVQCAEFCGVEHYAMRSAVHVFKAGSEPRIYGPPPQARPTTDVELAEPSATDWTLTPQNLTAGIGARLSLHIWNNGTNPHDFRIDPPVNASVPPIAPFDSAWLNVTVNAASPTPIPYGPSDPLARSRGMVGNLTIRSGRIVVIDLEDTPSGGLIIHPDPPENPLKMAKGETVTFLLKNIGHLDHNFQMGAPYEFVEYTTPIHPGQTIALGPFTFDENASNQYWCIIHKYAMYADYVVGAGTPQAGVPLFDMAALTIGVSVPVMFAYVVHHARRRDEPA